LRNGYFLEQCGLFNRFLLRILIWHVPY